MPKVRNITSKALGAFIHVIAWCGIFIFPLLNQPGPEGTQPDISFIINHLFFTSVMIAFFYLNYSLLIPRFFVKRKFLEYTGFTVTIFTLVIIVLSFFTPLLGMLIAPPQMPMPGHGFGAPPPDEHWFNPISIPAAVIIWIVSTGIKMTGEWYKSGRQKEAMEKEKLSAELAYLKAQINPHFIFNVLNNICSLARKKSDETEAAIIRLSQLLRYNLYDSAEHKVSLQKEIQYLHDYIDIQKMRLGPNVSINYTDNGNTEDIFIEPLLFLPFLENAFKFGISTEDECSINISITAEEQSVHFVVSNQVMVKKQEKGRQGIGLTNVRRRLSLLYPDKHRLDITIIDNVYTADLKIECHD
ncbi:MAG: histidine kinase [Bacteroidota bacterium]